MTEIDLQKIHGIKITLRWQSALIVISFATSTIIGSWKGGAAYNDFRNDYSNVKGLAIKHERQIPEMKQKYFADSLTFMALIKSIK